MCASPVEGQRARQPRAHWWAPNFIPEETKQLFGCELTTLRSFHRPTRTALRPLCTYPPVGSPPELQSVQLLKSALISTLSSHYSPTQVKPRARWGQRACSSSIWIKGYSVYCINKLFTLVCWWKMSAQSTQHIYSCPTRDIKQQDLWSWTYATYSSNLQQNAGRITSVLFQEH